MSRIFREIFCGHFPWKLKDENLRKFRQNFAAFFADLFETFRKNFALGDCGHHFLVVPKENDAKISGKAQASGGCGMSGRRTSGTSRPSFGVQVLAVFSSFPRENRSPKNVWENAQRSQTSSSRHPRPSKKREVAWERQICAELWGDTAPDIVPTFSPWFCEKKDTVATFLSSTEDEDLLSTRRRSRWSVRPIAGSNHIPGQ